MFRNSILVTLTISAFLLATARAEDWPKYRRDYANTGHSAEKGTLPNGVTTVSSSNVGSLKLLPGWPRALGNKISGTPAVVGGVVYVATWGGVMYALDAVSGAVRWSNNLCSCRIAGSPMVLNGVVYIGAANAKLYALNASTGTVLWSTLLTSQAGAEIWSSPVVFNGLVYVGVASHADAPCVKGAVYGVNASTGAIAWTFNTLNQATCPTGAGTCTGAGVWTSAAVDTAAGLVYIGTGNPGSTCSPSTASATQYPDSILALNAGTGALLNFFKAISNDTQDNDFGSSPVLLNSGATPKCVTTVAAQNWVAEGSKNASVYFVPRNSGGLSGSAKSISAGAGVVASPAVQAFCTSSGVANNLYIPTTGSVFTKIAQSGSGGLSRPFSTFITSSGMFSAPAMVNDLLLFGGKDNKLHAVTKFGSKIWSFTTGGFVNSGPAVSNGRIYFGSNDGNIYALSVNGK